MGAGREVSVMSAADATDTRLCPYCKEEIKSEAVRCKHCGSSVAPEKPSHGGTCPYCKEPINEDAIKCKHCGSMVAQTTTYAASGCGCRWDESEPTWHARFGLPSGFGRQAASPRMMQRAGIIRIPGPFGPIVIIGGPIDPGDPMYCEGHYVCTNWFGTDLCIWVCEWV